MKKHNPEELRRALKERDEALAFQAATDEILTAISRSTSDAKPVFDAIVRNVPRLFDTRYVAVFLIKGEVLHLAAAKADAAFQRRHGVRFRRFQESFPQPIHWGGFTGKALRSGKVSQIGPIIGNPKASPQAVKIAKEFGYNTMLVAPLMRDGKAIGAIGTTRPGVKLFSRKELALFKAFAAQAVIAIENARLFNETKEALEQQTATAEILKVISASPTSTQPVFESIVNNCGVLFKDSRVALWQISEGRLLPRASTGYMPGPMPLDRESAVGACVLESRTIHLADLRLAAEQHPRIKQLGLKHGYLSGVFAPLMREGQAIGAVSVLRRELGAFTDKEVALLGTFADQAVIAIENARLFNETKEALEQQTATAGVLRVIAASPTDLNPVMNAVVERAARLLEADHALIGQSDGESIHWLAAYGCPVPDGARSITRKLPSGRAILDLQTTQIEDIGRIERDPLIERSYSRFGVRTICATPLIREGRAVGVILLRRTQVRPFTEKQMALLRTFADQAVIAIENARLFNETKEALEQQTATAEILSVIARSQSDIQPVLDAVGQNAAHLCEANNAVIFRLEGDMLRQVASYGGIPTSSHPSAGLPVNRGTVTGRAVVDCQTIHVHDLAAETSEFPDGSRHARRDGHRTTLATPLVREGTPIGAILIRRMEVRPFSDNQIALLKTFADQAAIAIENVRLFNETKEALERQTATAEILKVISKSPSNIQPVFDAVADSAARLCDATDVIIRRIEGGVLRAVTHIGSIPLPAEVTAIPVSPKSPAGRAVIERRTIHIHDVTDDLVRSEYPEAAFQAQRGTGFRTLLIVPLVRNDVAVGTIAVRREEKRPFLEQQIGLLQTFADQAVIAIDNVRLFNETKEALERQTASAEILRVIAGTPADARPVFEAIAQSALSVFGASHVGVMLREPGGMRSVATAGSADPRGEFLIPLNRDSTAGRAALDRAALDIADTEAAGAPAFARESGQVVGFRAIAAAPMLRHGEAIGSVHIMRKAPGALSDAQIALLRSFADQAVIAIENARLFNETKEALEQQTASAGILRVISGTPSDTQPVFEAIVQAGLRVFAGAGVGVVIAYPDRVRVVAAAGVLGPMATKVDMPRSRESASGTAIVDGVVVNIRDTEAPDAPLYARENGRTLGFRAIAAAPMLREGEAIGAIGVVLREPGGLSDKQIGLLKTFADQAVIAIENARLFNETKEALERQTATAEILKVISASPTDVQPVFDAVAENAARVCGVDDVAILKVEEDGLRRVAHVGTVPVLPDPRLPLLPGGVNERVLAERRTVHIPDTAAPSFAAEFPGSQHAEMGVRSLLVTPLVRDGVVVGLIQLRRTEPRPFTDKQIALLETFAAQAVIAIENVRLFNETKEALERQTATGEILASMSGSMTDTKPVFDAIVRNLLRLFGAGYAVVSLRRGQFFELGGFEGEPGFEHLQDLYPIPVDEHSILGEVVMVRQVRRYAPVVGNSAVPWRTVEIGQRFGFNSIMAAPMMWEGEVIGTIVTARRQALSFDDKQVALIQSFADQAVIAIENVRLFKELQERTKALTKSVDQLTALGEVGQAISSTLELDQVLKAIVQRAVQLAGLDGGSIYEFDESDGRFHLRAAQNVAEEILAVYRASPIRLGEGALGRAGATREPVIVEDVLDPSYLSRTRELLIKAGSRALLAVPLLREDLLLGALVVSRKSPGPFAPEVVELLKTFATQSAVAIQNARLFREIEEKSRQLEEASRHKSQFLASMSHELRTPLNAILGFNEMILGQIYGEVPSDMKEPLEDIQKSGKHLLRLINNVLDLAKIEAGRMELALADYSVQDTVESVRSTLRPLAEAKGLELVVTVPEDIPLAYGDGGRLTQCLMNLAGNSLKFTKEGRVEIAVEAENGHLRYRVSDTGIGIPPDKIPTLFSEFRQTDATIASEYGGTGLGLSITKKFVEMHGGRIWVESEPGKGSVFTVEIPLRVSAPA